MQVEDEFFGHVGYIDLKKAWLVGMVCRWWFVFVWEKTGGEVGGFLTAVIVLLSLFLDILGISTAED